MACVPALILSCVTAFRFQGLKVPSANNSLWFYSIQGLFRVAFEMYSTQEQLAVLEDLQVRGQEASAGTAHVLRSVFFFAGRLESTD